MSSELDSTFAQINGSLGRLEVYMKTQVATKTDFDQVLRALDSLSRRFDNYVRTMVRIRAKLSSHTELLRDHEARLHDMESA